MTKEKFEKLSEELKMDVCREIAYSYAVFVPKDEPSAISELRSIFYIGDNSFFDKNVLESAQNKRIVPYDVVMGKIEKMVENYYQEFNLGINAQKILADYGERGEKFSKYFADCMQASQNTIKNAVQQELIKQLRRENDVKASIKGVGTVIERRTQAVGRLLESLFQQMEQLMALWDYQDKGYTKYRINAVGENCEECQSINGKIFNIADSTVGQNLVPFHPNCDCIIEVLDEQDNAVYTYAKPEQDEAGWRKYLKASIDQLILGNYTDDVNFVGTAMQVLSGFFGIDFPADARDLFYDITNFEVSIEHIGQTLLDLAALLPMVGAIKYTDEAGAVIKSGVKNIDEVAEVVKNTIKSNKISGITDNLKSISGKYKLTDSGYFGDKGKGRTFTRNISSKNAETTAKDFYETISQGGIKYSHAKGEYTKMSDGTIISYRGISSSDGTPVVEINVQHSINNEKLKNQKIHFVEED